MSEADVQSDQRKRWTSRRGLRLLTVVGALLLLSGAGQAFAGKDSREDPESRTGAPPSAKALRSAAAPIEAAKRRVEARERWRESAEAERARLHSRAAHADASRTVISRLLRDEFPGFLGSNDPVIDPDDVRRYTSDYTAVLEPDADGKPGGGPKLAVSSVPLRTWSPSGAKVPVDLSLEGQDGRLSPAAPLVRFSLPERLGAGVDLPAGITVTVPSADPQIAASRVTSDTALYPDIATDTDLVASSLPAGVELSHLLRSPASPESQSFELSLPAGARLESSPDGGAQVVRDGGPILRISPAAAVDAQGAPVPVTMKVDGDSLRLSVRHREGDFAYPILVDPTGTVYDDYQWVHGSTRLDGWRGYNPSGTFSLSGSCMFGIACYGPSGLYVYSWAGRSYGNGSVAGYEYYVPGAGEGRTTYVSRLVLAPLYQYRERDYNLAPFLFVGLWDSTYGDWANSRIAYDTYGYSNSMDLLSGAHYPKRVNVQQYSNYNVTLSGHHVSYVGAVTVVLDDGEAPTLDALTSSTGAPAWVDHETGTFALHAHDNGLGVHDFVTKVPDTNAPSGSIDATLPTTESPGCTGATGSMCPVDGHAELAYDTARFPEGVNRIEVVGRDAATQGDGKPGFVLVDRSGPTMNVTGGLIDSALPDYRLRVDAGDGDSSTLESARSGVKSIEILWDGQRLDYEEQPACDNQQQGLAIDFGSCGLSLSGSVDSSVSGRHQLRVVVKDQVGHATTRDWDLNLPDRTKPQLEAHGPLVDSGSSPVAGLTPLAVDARDSGTGVTHMKLLLDGQPVGSVTEGCPAGGCDLSREFLVDLSSKTAGSHKFEAVAYDGVGNQTRIVRTISLDPAPPALTVLGRLVSANGKPLTTQTALAYISASDGSGGSGVSRLQVELDGDVVATTDSACSPTCPDPASMAYTYDKTRVQGLSPHEVRIVAKDRAGNKASRILSVDDPITPQDLQCPQAGTAAAPVSPLTAQQATQKIESAHPSLVAASVPATVPNTSTRLDPSLEPPAPPDTNLDITGSANGGEAPRAAAEGLIVGGLCLRPTATTTAATNATIVHGDTALYANTAPQTDTVVRPTATGATAIEAIRGPQAPQTFSWKVGLRGDEQLRKLSNGAIAVVDPTEPRATAPGSPLPPQAPKAQTPAGVPDVATQLASSAYQIAKAEQLTGQSVVAVIAPPWARDSAGKLVPATLTVNANTITLTVVHWTAPAPLVYPVVGVTDTWGRPIGAGDAAGGYSFGDAGCQGEASDPTGVIFAGTHASVSNTADMISRHAGWSMSGQQVGDQGMQVWFRNGTFGCRANDEGMATGGWASNRYHARLWLSRHPNGRPKTAATPHYEQVWNCSYWTWPTPTSPSTSHRSRNTSCCRIPRGPGATAGSIWHATS